MAGVLGTVGGAARPRVDDAGRVTTDAVHVDWWVGADDRWHVPAEERTTRTLRLGPAPVYETTVRIPGGVAIRRVYAAQGPGEPVVVEVENASPHAFALAHVLAAARAGHGTRVECDDRGVLVDGQLALALARSPSRSAAATGGSVREVVMAGDATEGAFPAVAGPAVEVAVLFPVAHRTVARAAVVAASSDRSARWSPLSLPSVEDVQRGWSRLLDRGARVELPEPWQAGVDAARADLLLAPPSAPVAVALEDWGFDDEFHEVWERLRGRERRAARRRDRPASPYAAAQAARATDDPAALLRSVRAVLVEERDGGADLLPAFPADWLGADLAVHGLPVRGGTVAFALRWHGARPALLWDAPRGFALRAPALDPAWHADGGAGEALLDEPAPALLAMGTPPPAGTTIAAPGSSFS